MANMGSWNEWGKTIMLTKDLQGSYRASVAKNPRTFPWLFQS